MRIAQVVVLGSGFLQRSEDILGGSAAQVWTALNQMYYKHTKSIRCLVCLVQQLKNTVSISLFHEGTDALWLGSDGPAH